MGTLFGRVDGAFDLIFTFFSFIKTRTFWRISQSRGRVTNTSPDSQNRGTRTFFPTPPLSTPYQFSSRYLGLTGFVSTTESDTFDGLMVSDPRNVSVVNKKCPDLGPFRFYLRHPLNPRPLLDERLVSTGERTKQECTIFSSPTETPGKKFP